VPAASFGLFGGVVFAVIFWPVYHLPPLGVLSALIGGAVFVRALWICFVVGPDDLFIRNYFRTYRVPWTEIDRLGWKMLWLFAPYGAGSALPALAMKLRSGKVIIASATVGCGKKKAARLEQAVHDFA